MIQGRGDCGLCASQLYIMTRRGRDQPARIACHERAVVAEAGCQERTMLGSAVKWMEFGMLCGAIEYTTRTACPGVLYTKTGHGLGDN